MATVHPPPSFALPRSHADVAVPEDSESESVAESSCSHRPTASGFLAGECYDDDDGCSSCVEGDECCYLQELQEADEEEEEEEEEEVSTGSVWWIKKRRLAAAAGPGDVSFPAATAGRARQPRQEREEEDPERVAARQEEDRKFWEECLATGYP